MSTMGQSQELGTAHCDNTESSFPSCFFLFFPSLWHECRVHDNNWKNTHEDGGHRSIMSSVSCYFSLIFSSMFAWPHPTRPVFCLSHSAVSLPAGLPPPAAIAKRGLKTRGKATHPVGTHAAHQKKMDTTQINLQSAPHLALHLQTPAETIQKPEQTSISGITLQHHLRLISSFCVRENRLFF